jgi:2-polyprenyl-6-methoxyphenol hydroxylase-like FAD-dependent oxidoreductase
MTSHEVPVLVVGGGPAGLAASLALSACGVESLAVDRHPGTTNHPKATVVNVRTMELFRQWGLADAVAKAGIPATDLRCVCWSTTLAGFEIGRIDLAGALDDTAARTGLDQSPALPVMCPQDVLEPLMRAAAEACEPATVRYGHELVELRQDATGVTARVADLAAGDTYEVRAGYLLGCDGRAGAVRPAVGIGTSGKDPLGGMLNIYLRADLTHLVAHRLSPLYWIVNPDTPGVLITLNGTDRWLLNVPYDGRTEHPPERCAELARRAIGDDTVDVEVLGVNPWQMTRVVADRFRADRVFLAGDAAHQFPPTGGHGMNSGIQDAHNLGWKLAAVLQGWAGEGLLDSYEAERRPVALRLTEESVGNAAAMRGELRPPPEIEHDTDEGQAIRDVVAGAVTRNRGHFISTGLTLGTAYRSRAVIAGEPAEPARDDDVEHYVPTPLAGHRAPHVVVGEGDDGETFSLLDLYCDVPVLVTPSGAAWDEAAETVAEELDVPVRAFVAARAGGADAVAERYRLAPDGAALVRPDGYILWRSEAMPADPADELRRVVTEGLDR